MHKQTLILALGSEILRDDGIPIKILNELKKNKSFRQCDFKSANIGGLDLLELITGYKRVFIIDSMKTMQGIPGNVLLIDALDIKRTMHLTEFHNVSLTTILALGEMLDYSMPKNIYIIAVEIVEDKVFTSEISNRLLKRFSNITERVTQIINNILKGKQSLTTN